MQKGGLPPCGAEIAALKPVRWYSPVIKKPLSAIPRLLNSERLDLVPKMGEPMRHPYFAALVVVIAANVVAIGAIATTIKRDLARAWEP